MFINLSTISKIYTLGKNERLKSRKQIDQLFGKSNSFSLFPIRVLYLIDQPLGASLQAGFSVSTKKFKKAVDRNRIKRLLREAYRMQKKIVLDNLQQRNKGMSVFFIYTGKELPEYPALYTKMGEIINKLNNLLNEEVIANS